MAGAKPNRILVVGQTPPPTHGQAMMINSMLSRNYNGVKIYHVRMAFSNEMYEVSRFKFSKLFHLIGVIVKIYYYRIKYRPDILYYPPAGPSKIPIVRDFVILSTTRWLFRRTIFQFYAGGVSDYLQHLPSVVRLIVGPCYRNPDIAIRPSVHSPNDPMQLEAQKEYIVPWGVEDNYGRFSVRSSTRTMEPVILFVGALRETKGVEILIEAISLLKQRKVRFKLEFMGTFDSNEFKEKVKRSLASKNLEQCVRFLGERHGDSYYDVYAKANIFCFPSFYESESVPVVLVDAIQFGLPIVATRWRGIPEIVTDKVNGFLISVRDSKSVSDKLHILLQNQKLRTAMGNKGRQAFLRNFTFSKYQERLGQVFTDPILSNGP